MNKTTLTISEGTRVIFDICQIVEEIVIPEGVAFIEGYAFCDCSSLTSITIPNSVISIGNKAFYGCEYLKAIYIDKEKDSLDISDTGIPKNTKVYWRGEWDKEEENEIS